MTARATTLPALLPDRTGETDAEKRFREAINRLGGQLLQTLDAAIMLRTADQNAQRTRHLARNDLSDFAQKAMHAFYLAQAGTPTTDQIRRRASD
ncbi:MAG: hypothetical protein RL268_2408 [Pseudomonadota bacterium]|jgi:hypothetical protein